jgi:alkylhydroperoxidase/carboxymuconolactone decarboxylase family protein YurZ
LQQEAFVTEEILVKARATIAEYLGRSSHLSMDSDDYEKITIGTLFGEIWSRPGLEWRDRSLITLTTLIVQGHTNELKHHMIGAKRLGFTLPQIEEICLHLSCYVGFHVAHAAVQVARTAFGENDSPG